MLKLEPHVSPVSPVGLEELVGAAVVGFPPVRDDDGDSGGMSVGDAAGLYKCLCKLWHINVGTEGIEVWYILISKMHDKENK